jgi:hypothetical protein
MTNSSALLRSILIFSISLPLAILMGYTLAGPFDYTFVGVIGGVFFLLITPWMLRQHRPLLLLGWNATMIVFFLPGSPPLWLPLVLLSLTISIFHRAIDQDFRFISVPELTWPLVALAAVVLATAEATGGIKLRSMGGSMYGGRNYLLVLTAILGYFALTAQAIPRERASLYVGFFILSGLTTLIGDVLYFQNPGLRFLYMFFQPNLTTAAGSWTSGAIERFYGIYMGSQVVMYYMLARHGIRNIFSSRHPWRAGLFVLLAGTSLLGGFRSALVGLFILMSIQFYLEGLHRTKLVVIIPVGLVLMAAIALPHSRQFPRTIQRALSFLPVDVDPDVKREADLSSEWRFGMWQALLPQVTQYLLLGKGYALTTRDWDYMLATASRSMQSLSGQEDPLAVGQNYHNGPLSVTLPFGIWGDLAFLWFLVASIRVLHRNYRYGDPSLLTVNAFLLTMFLAKTVAFLLIYGALFNDMQVFVGYVGLSVALNGGACSPAPQPGREAPPIAVAPELQSASQRSRSRT